MRSPTMVVRGRAIARGLGSKPERGAFVGVELVDEANLPGEIGPRGIEVALVASERVEDEVHAIGVGGWGSGRPGKRRGGVKRVPPRSSAGRGPGPCTRQRAV